MADHQAERAQLSADIDAAALQKAEEYVEQEEGAANKLRGRLAIFITLTAVVMSAFHLYTAYAIVPTQTLRPVHVAFVLFLLYLVFPVAERFRHRVKSWDWLPARVAVGSVVYLRLGRDALMARNPSPRPWDIAFGIPFNLLILDG